MTRRRAKTGILSIGKAEVKNNHAKDIKILTRE